MLQLCKQKKDIVLGRTISNQICSTSGFSGNPWAISGFESLLSFLAVSAASRVSASFCAVAALFAAFCWVIAGFGLWAALGVLSSLGFLAVVAARTGSCSSQKGYGSKSHQYLFHSTNKNLIELWFKGAKVVRKMIISNFNYKILPCVFGRL